MSLAELRDALRRHERSARDFFDALVALGMLQRLPDGRYADTAETGLHLDRMKPSCAGGIPEMMNGRLYRFWGRLTEALQTGLPQNETWHGEPDLFAAVHAEPSRLELFLGAMTGLSLPAARAIATAFPWREYRTFADAGCAQGGLTAEIARAHPHLTGHGFDLPVVRPVFARYMAQHGLDRRLTFQAGDFFKDRLAASNHPRLVRPSSRAGRRAAACFARRRPDAGLHPTRLAVPTKSEQGLHPAPAARTPVFAPRPDLFTMKRGIG